MKTLAFTVGDTHIESPGGLSNVTSEKAGFLGKNIISLALSLLFLGATILSLFYLILGGIQWITSGGDPKAIDAAKTKLVYAVLGLVLTFSSYLIIAFIGHVFSIDLLALPTS